eukprot:258259_1
MFCWQRDLFFVTASGIVYAHGRNGSGQLGLGKSNVSNQMKPVLVETLSDHKIIEISGSHHGSHTIFLTSKGKIFCAGHNGSGQVKFKQESSISDPYDIIQDDELQKIVKKKGKKYLYFIDIAAGCNRSGG